MANLSSAFTPSAFPTVDAPKNAKLSVPALRLASERHLHYPSKTVETKRFIDLA